MRTAIKILALIGVFIAIGIAGKYDYAEQVIQTLSYSQYEAILSDLGGSASDIKVVEAYTKNKAHYDSIK